MNLGGGGHSLMVTFTGMTWLSLLLGNFPCQYLSGCPHGLVMSPKKTPPNSCLESEGLAVSVCLGDDGEK